MAGAKVKNTRMNKKSTTLGKSDQEVRHVEFMNIK